MRLERWRIAVRGEAGADFQRWELRGGYCRKLLDSSSRSRDVTEKSGRETVGRRKYVSYFALKVYGTLAQLYSFDCTIIHTYQYVQL